MTRLDRAIAAYKRAAETLATADARTQTARQTRDQRIADIYEQTNSMRQTAVLTGLSHMTIVRAVTRAAD